MSLSFLDDKLMGIACGTSPRPEATSTQDEWYKKTNNALQILTQDMEDSQDHYISSTKTVGEVWTTLLKLFGVSYAIIKM